MEYMERVSGEVIPPYANYAEYKKEFDREIRQEVEGYVRIGYLLKIARDTRILYDSGYANLYEFAENEYHIDKSRVSRYMAINDRFAQGGYSPELREEYRGYGVAKLSMMLTLPDEINEELSPELTKSEIQDIRDEVAEEQKTTPIEHMMEGETETTEHGETLLEKVIFQLGESEPGLYREMHEALKDGPYMQDVKGILAPAGEKIYSVRIRGIGRIMLVLRDDEDEVTLVNERTGEKETGTWEDIEQAWIVRMIYEMTAEKSWEKFYGQPFPEVAPVQPEKKVVKVNPEPAKSQKQQPAGNFEQKKDENPVEQTIKDWETRMSEPAKPVETQAAEDLAEQQSEGPKEQTSEEQTEEQQSEPTEQQLPGQMSVENFPECMPTPTISRAEFDRKNGEYKNALASNIADAEIAAWDEKWTNAREDLQNALAVIDKLEALHSMEVVDEEEQAVES